MWKRQVAKAHNKLFPNIILPGFILHIRQKGKVLWLYVNPMCMLAVPLWRKSVDNYISLSSPFVPDRRILSIEC